MAAAQSNRIHRPGTQHQRTPTSGETASETTFGGGERRRGGEGVLRRALRGDGLRRLRAGDGLRRRRGGDAALRRSGVRRRVGDAPLHGAKNRKESQQCSLAIPGP